MRLPDRVHIYADCAVNPAPSARQLADIVIRSADPERSRPSEPQLGIVAVSAHAPAAFRAEERNETLVADQSRVASGAWRRPHESAR
ncbi:MAG: hypothetical protein JO168_21015 [Solirubrobacterales bacterium]|nr:hypothetical protein [Solirubrobacterales bacterium]